MSKMMLKKGLPRVLLLPVQGDNCIYHSGCSDDLRCGVIHAEYQVTSVDMPVL